MCLKKSGHLLGVIVNTQFRHTNIIPISFLKTKENSTWWHHKATYIDLNVFSAVLCELALPSQCSQSTAGVVKSSRCTPKALAIPFIIPMTCFYFTHLSIVITKCTFARDVRLYKHILRAKDFNALDFHFLDPDPCLYSGILCCLVTLAIDLQAILLPCISCVGFFYF